MAPTNKKQALGKGIRALLNNIDEELSNNSGSMPVDMVNHGTVTRIDIKAIQTNPKQPRRDFDKEALKELADSIATHDIIQPITVIKIAEGKYQLISGERRWRASKLAGLKDIPAYIRTANEQEQLELALIENLQREDLNAIEIALSYQMLIEEAGLTQEELAGRMNKERSTVTNYLRLLKLPPDIQNAVRNNDISMGHARGILGLDSIEKQLYAFREVKEKQLSVRQLEALVKAMTQPGKSQPSKTTKQLPQAYKKIQDNMSSHFSTKVTMDRKTSGHGSITIAFYNDEDLERIMEKMNL